jgi:eukaryotic-like serine/threonine-protein kinase
MNTESSRDILIFMEGFSLPPEDRRAYLERSCGDDNKLRGRIEQLFKVYDQAGSFLEEPPSKIVSERIHATLKMEKPGDFIGNYKLLRQIGEGGWGRVFLAQQEGPVRRKLALKAIKPGMETRAVIAQFEAERQALALMDHPNIAHIFDGGATPAGRPFFVMEFVPGVKITDYCRLNSLPTCARLALFITVCDAVQHAHQKGIIHRDIKPSNILVAEEPNGKPFPKVIDFGIARSTANQPLPEKAFSTEKGMLIGTPAYMSPEQASHAPTDIDTRADVYSLGVLLYELLTGTTPFNYEALLKAGLDEMRRVITVENPVPPSARLDVMPRDDLRNIAQLQRVEPSTLICDIRGDLDWIVLKALEKDRVQRYPTAHGLAMDLRHYLANEPVVGRPASGHCKFPKRVRLNKRAFSRTSRRSSVPGFSWKKLRNASTQNQTRY